MLMGIKNCHYALEGSAPVAMPGAVSFDLSKNINAVTKKIRLSNGVVAEIPITATRGMMTAELDIESLPVSFLVDVLGYYYDERGVFNEPAKHTFVPFYLQFETGERGEPLRRQYQKCFCKAPDLSVSTLGDKAEITAQKLEIFIADCSSKSITENANKELYDSWFTTVCGDLNNEIKFQKLPKYIYDSLHVKDENTLYLVTDGKEMYIYWGNKKLGEGDSKPVSCSYLINALKAKLTKTATL